MSFKDILKKSFLEGYASSTISTIDIVACLAVTLMLGAFIFVVYRMMTKRTFYDQSFNISLPLMALITAGIIITIQNSVVVSLGMVGALSIVRFRTAVKNPIDLVFLFWAISCGIICGAGLASIAVILSLVITLSMVVLNMLPNARAAKLLVVNSHDAECAKKVEDIVKEYSKLCKIKANTISADSLDMVIEVEPSDENAMLKKLSALEGMISVSCVSHDGDVTF